MVVVYVEDKESPPLSIPGAAENTGECAMEVRLRLNGVWATRCRPKDERLSFFGIETKNTEVCLQICFG